MATTPIANNSDSYAGTEIQQIQHADRVAVRLPPFLRNNPVVLWFVQMKVQFSVVGITPYLI